MRFEVADETLIGSRSAVSMAGTFRTPLPIPKSAEISPAAAVLLTAMFTVHLRYGFSSIKILAILASRLAFELPRAPADSQLTLFAPFVLFVAIPVFGSAVLYAAGNAATGNTLSTGALAN
jgi:hypothetical protein